MLSILLADDHEVMRRGLREVLEEQHGWMVCAEACDGRQAVALALQHRPDVAIVDLSMPALNGIEAARQICADLPATEVLIYAGSDTDRIPRAALDAGARGCVLKNEPAAELIQAVAALARHTSYFSPRTRGPAPASGHRDRRRAGIKGPRLTAREREIAQLLAEGKTNLCVGTILGISVKTVETHRANIMDKLGLESVVELVHYAVRNEMVVP
jgi:DNA-binding NarL/FixJ family response regulator